MNFSTTLFLSSISTGIKLFSGFIINKIISIHIGVAGFAIIGQFRDFVTTVTGICNGGIQLGIVKYSSDYKNDDKRFEKLLSTSLTVGLISSILLGLMLYIFNESLSIYIFGNKNNSQILTVFAITLYFFVLHTIFMSILNGRKELKKFILADICSSIIGLFITSFLIYFYQLKGGLFAIAINQSVSVFGTFFFLKSSKWFKVNFFLKGIDKAVLFKLLNFAFMSIISALTVPLVTFLIRRYIGETLSWTQAGYWEATWRFSAMYLLILTTSYSIYLVPTFSTLQGKELRAEIFKIWKIIIPVSISMAMFIYIFKDTIILLLFSDSFMPMSELFFFQLCGDIIKIISWVLGNIIIAKAMTRIFIFIQIGSSITFLLLSIIFLNIYGLEGVSLAYFINYLILFLFFILFFRKILWWKIIEKSPL